MTRAADLTPPQAREHNLRLVVWGTYDLGKPRVRILLRGLRANGVSVTECHVNVWAGVEDKSQIAGWKSKLRFGLRWLAAYPVLVYRYLRMPDHDLVLVCYMGQMDVLILWACAKLRRKPIVWDAFISLYNTVVEDRRILGARHPLAYLLYVWEWLACRAADLLILDTATHGRYFVDRFHIAPEKVKRIFVGAEPENFATKQSPGRDPDAPVTALFYGQFIPLHGINTIVRAAARSGDLDIDWVIIGNGQEAENIRKLVRELSPARLRWIEWVPYEELIEWIQNADVCLGVFGRTEKAARVIPNKVFQIIAAGRPLITRDSPAIRELLHDGIPDITLIPPGDPDALLEGVKAFIDTPKAQQCESRYTDIVGLITPAALGAELIAIILDAVRPNSM